MFYTEAYKERLDLESKLKKRWEKALNANGGIADEHLARTTAILCENYLTELKNDARLIAEDRVQTGQFRGVNLALLGLITRVIPNLVGAELVGIQAMPTPRAPIFTMTWHKENTKSYTTGRTSPFPTLPDGDEMWVTPIDTNVEFGGVDPYYSSNEVYEKSAIGSVTNSMQLKWAAECEKLGTVGYVFQDSIVIYCFESDQAFPTYGSPNWFARIILNDSGVPVCYNNAGVAQTIGATAITWTSSTATIANLLAYITTAVTGVDAVLGKTTSHVLIGYQYDAEAEGIIPEISFKISEESIKLIRRQLRGKYTVDAVQDLKVLHGVNLDSELVNMMKNELMHEINHEIVTDLRKMAKHVKTLDFNDFVNYTAGTAGAVTTGNYEDAARVMLDAINKMAAIIWTQGRMGYGNWVVGNPEDLCYLDRVPGFVGSGVSFNGRDISFAGSAGGKMKIYHDPTFPTGELLTGYKGTSALEAGYLYCPYLPITATPTLYDPETGDPSKIFYTRYSKTLKESGDTTLKVPKSVILNGELQYGRIKLSHFPGDALLA